MTLPKKRIKKLVWVLSVADLTRPTEPECSFITRARKKLLEPSESTIQTNEPTLGRQLETETLLLRRYSCGTYSFSHRFQIESTRDCACVKTRQREKSEGSVKPTKRDLLAQFNKNWLGLANGVLKIVMLRTNTQQRAGFRNLFNWTHDC